jgi:hypothetical protein
MCFSSSAETDTTAAREDTTASGPPPEADLTTTEDNTSTNLEIPDGVDLSFLAALPDKMRQEVISEQLRSVSRSIVLYKGSNTKMSYFVWYFPDLICPSLNH